MLCTTVVSFQLFPASCHSCFPAIYNVVLIRRHKFLPFPTLFCCSISIRCCAFQLSSRVVHSFSSCFPATFWCVHQALQLPVVSRVVDLRHSQLPIVFPPLFGASSRRCSFQLFSRPVNLLPEAVTTSSCHMRLETARHPSRKWSGT